MKKYSIYKIMPLFILVFIVNACNDEFLETKPIAMASTESFYTTMSSVDMATTVCYSNFCMEKLWDLSIMMTMGSIASDEAECGAGGKSDVIEYQLIDQLRHTSATANIFEWTWGYLYRTIGYCNVALERIPEVSAETDPDYNAALVKKRLGEVYFIRAYNFFTLTQLYGGVPLVDHVLSPSEYFSPRNEIHEVYTLIKADLEKAIEYLPTKSGWGSGDIGRASKGAAMSLLSKVYLYESSYAKNYQNDERFNGLNIEWEQAAYWAEQVALSNEYQLVGANGERYNTWRSPNTGGYKYQFMLDGENSSEAIFEIQNAQDGKVWFDTRGTGLVRWCAPRKINPIGEETEDGMDYGWGWWCPTDFLANSYEVGDPRYKATILESGDSILCNFSSDDGGVAWRTVNYNILEDGTGLNRGTKKYECSYEEYWQNSITWSDGPVNVKLMRYADILLYAAEAYLESGNQSKALEYINMVRTRARLSGETGVPANLNAITHDDIVQERLVELALEGHRYFDLIRWNMANEKLNHTLADGDEIEWIKGVHEFFPIPDKEIGLSKGTLEQYDGW